MYEGTVRPGICLLQSVPDDVPFGLSPLLWAKLHTCFSRMGWEPRTLPHFLPYLLWVRILPRLAPAVDGPLTSTGLLLLLLPRRRRGERQGGAPSRDPAGANATGSVATTTGWREQTCGGDRRPGEQREGIVITREPLCILTAGLQAHTSAEV